MESVETGLSRLVVRVVEVSRRHALLVVGLALVLSVALGLAAANRLGMDTDVDKLLSEREPWRQQEIRYDAAFPHLAGTLALVVEAATPDQTDDAAAALAARLEAQPALFKRVTRPDAEPYFRRNGLLFLSRQEVAETTGQIIEAQAFIGSLAADPSLRGLFGTLNLALEGVARGAAEFSRLEKPLAAIAGVIEASLAGREQPLSWQSLLTGRTPRPEEMRRFVLTQPARDFGELGSVEPAIAAIRQATRDLGLSAEQGVRVRLTGAPAIENDELKTLSDGAELSLGLSFGLVTLVLFLALRSGRLILPIVITLIAGLVATAGFAALAVGTLNPISVAFAVLFLGLAADFSIQVAVRYREERFLHPDPAVALRQTGAGIAGALTLAAGANAVGFFSFLPTAYVGVSQLGLIAGVGMLIALAYNFTLLPALIALFRPPGEAASVGFARAVPVDRWLVRHRLPVSLAAVLAALAGLAAIPALRFDFNPMNLRDAKTESVATALDLFDNPDTTPFSIDLLVPSAAQARALAARLEALPEVHRALALTSFVPEDQEAKLALIEDAALLLGPTLSPGTVAPPPSPQAVRETLAATLAGLARSGASPVAVRLAGLIDQVLHRDEGVLARLERNLMAGLPARLADLREALAAAPASLDSLPESLRRDWVAPDGAYRIHVAPTGDATDNAVLIRFVEAVRALAPEATGPAVTIQGSAHTIIRAFLEAGAISLVTVVLLLWLILRRWSDVVLVLVPLMLSALLTVITCVTLGPALNFANVIALPLLLGIGVAFNIYFVVNHRHDGTGPLQSSTARAVLFSALTTVVAFGSLALSNHPGTASMGVLLTISLGYTLLTTLVVLPALLGWKAGWSQRIAAATAPGFSRAPPAAGGTP